MTDKHTGTAYLIDTGVDVSVVPATRTDRREVSDLVLYAANGSTIHTFGKGTLTLNLGLR